MVREILTIESGMLALTPTTLRHQMRRGIPKFTYRSESLRNMLCMIQMKENRVVLGGHKDELVELDLETLTETNLVRISINFFLPLPKTQPISKLHFHSPFVAVPAVLYSAFIHGICARVMPLVKSPFVIQIR